MDALTLLTADHNRVRGLFEQFKEAKEEDDLERMRGVAGRIVEELRVHTTIEEEVFYPEVRDLSEDVHELVVEGLEEHHVVENLMGELGEVDPGDEHWAAKVTVLIENVEHHAEEEESEMFGSIRSAMSDDELSSLGERLEEKKRQLGAPTSADTIDLTKEELLEKARAQSIPGRSSMSREELAATVAPE